LVVFNGRKQPCDWVEWTIELSHPDFWGQLEQVLAKTALLPEEIDRLSPLI
jgi:hypothetical protein